MRRPGWIRPVRPPGAEGPAPLGSRRDRLARQLAVVTAVCLTAVFILSKGPQFLMPGPLTSAHGAIENCGTCHTKSGSGKLSWVHSLVAGDPLADSKACLTCHKMPDTAFNAHGASAEVLKESTERLMKIAARSPQPQSARAQSIAFPTHDMVARGLYCATCHQEHQGVNFDLNKISSEQCRSCHVVKFDSFDGHHPKFDNYPFERRTRIIYDHAGHFGKHYPDVAKKGHAKRIPATCSTCHDSRNDRRIMAVAPFEGTCSACHLDQIIGKERVSGPKGIAFLALPGLDLPTLTKKKAAIGEWPDASEADLTPFMKVMISRNERGRALIKTIESLNLQDLTDAGTDEIKAVTELVWEIKRLFHALISEKASDALAGLDMGGGAKLGANAIADLTASIPREVVVGAQQQWLPNLAKEVANRRDTSEPKRSGLRTVIAEVIPTGSTLPEELFGSATRQTNRAPGTGAALGEAAGSAKPIRLSQAKPAESEAAQIGEAPGKADAHGIEPGDGAAAPSADERDGGVIIGRRSLPSGTPRAIKARSEDAGKAAEPKEAARKVDTTTGEADGGKDAPAAEQRGVMKADGKEAPSTDAQPQGTATEQSDDLLFPTDAELAEIKAREKGGRPAGATGKTETANPKPDGGASAESAAKAEAGAPAAAPANATAGAAEPQTPAASAPGIDSDVDPESWAEYGGWYRHDYAIFYRPTGHKDKFITSWLVLTGPQAARGDRSPASAVFDFLTNKDAQGSCTKCHSVDDAQGKGRVVNFSPPSLERKNGRFTNFIHEPHFGILENRGCLACHDLEKDRPYLKSYEQGDPHNFASNFGAVRKDLCQTCHTGSAARQDCLLCHKYHVNGVMTPIMRTKIPGQ